jgi:hypothetical protein
MKSDIIRAQELRSMSDMIADRFMPLCTCGRADCGSTSVADTVRRINRTLNERADRLDPARTDPWETQ